MDLPELPRELATGASVSFAVYACLGLRLSFMQTRGGDEAYQFLAQRLTDATLTPRVRAVYLIFLEAEQRRLGGLSK